MKWTTIVGTTTTAPEYFVYGTERIARIDGWTNAIDRSTFFLYDHLGNTRVSFTASDLSPLELHITYAGDYFPYGKVLREFVDGDGGDRYLTTMHERDKETGLDYRGARYYDSDVARFLSLDPLAEKYPSLSPYNYVGGMPVIAIDPDGEKIIFVNKRAIEEGNKWLKDLGLENEFHINRRGVLKKTWTPFRKNNELTKALKKEVRGRDIVEIALSNKEDWNVVQYHNSDFDEICGKGSGSGQCSGTVDYETLLTMFSGRQRHITTLVFTPGEINSETTEKEINAKDIISDAAIIESPTAAKFIGGVVGEDGENLARAAMSIPGVVPKTSLPSFGGLNTGKCQEGDCGRCDPVNSNDEGGPNNYVTRDFGFRK